MSTEEKKAKPSCGNCRFMNPTQGPGGIVLFCRRNPPTVISKKPGMNRIQYEAVNPPVAPGAWCGEYQKLVAVDTRGIQGEVISHDES